MSGPCPYMQRTTMRLKVWSGGGREEGCPSTPLRASQSCSPIATPKTPKGSAFSTASALPDPGLTISRVSRSGLDLLLFVTIRDVKPVRARIHWNIFLKKIEYMQMQEGRRLARVRNSNGVRVGNFVK